MAQARRGGQIQSKLGFLIYGNKGTWKSSLAAQLGDMIREKGQRMNVLYIDTENGSVDDLLNQKASEGIDVSNIYVVYTTSFEEVVDFVKQAKIANTKTPIVNRYIDDDGKMVNEPLTNEDGSYFIPDAIVIDSLSVLYDSLVQATTQFSQKRAGVRANRNGLVGAEKAVAVIEHYKNDRLATIENLKASKKKYAAYLRLARKAEQIFKDMQQYNNEIQQFARTHALSKYHCLSNLWLSY